MKRKRHRLIINFMRQHKIGLDEVIDVSIRSNGIIGVGLITLANNVSKYITNKANEK